MIIDKPQADSLPALKRLWQEAFGDSAEFVDAFFRAGFSPVRCRCLWKNDSLAAALYWFDCNWEGRKLAYLYAIATDKAFRNQGLCRALMENTHRHLKNSGYGGAVLVPGNAGLFSFYAKLDYLPFCPKEETIVFPGMLPTQVTRIDLETYRKQRSGFLPKNSVAQQEAVFAFLSAFGEFYEGENALFCLSREGDTLYFQEFLGNETRLPGILTALQAEKGIVHLPGAGTPSAMYRSFTGDAALPDYFAIALN